MDWKGEAVNSRMLQVKWEVFEKELSVPEGERLPGPGCIQSFCLVWVDSGWWNCSSLLNRHKLKEIQKHGEAGLVDIGTVEAERSCIRELLAGFQPEDWWNVDESALFAFAPPHCKLSQRQMSGKKANKFQITLTFACNANSSEKKDLFFIGKSMKPQCFGRQGPIVCGFYYHSNKTAWMTGALFEEWEHEH